MDLPKLLYGGDYNAEQWLDVPGIWDEDMRLMDLARVNEATIGVFSWVSIEPQEGQFDFSWMDSIVEKLSANGKSLIMATPSGAKPGWMSAKYPEIRRVTQAGQREPHGNRHNHCPTSPVYRAKVAEINRRLSERYGALPNLVLWHVSNEYSGYCYCELCYEAFRQWLKRRYGTLEALNTAWWSRFWSHTFTDWSQIDSLDDTVNAMLLDWRRFMTDQCVDFMLGEINAVRSASPGAKFTTNMMGTYDPLNYWKFAPHLDVISWDSYPDWHSETSDWKVANFNAFLHDLNRSLKHGQPYLLMETTPSGSNWSEVCRTRRPAMNRLNGLQAIAHGSDGVMYFQWRKSRGSAEKFHGAIVDHVGHENTRVFREVSELGSDLERLAPVVGSRVKAEIALVFDWENRWAIEYSRGPRNIGKNYEETAANHHIPFWRRGIATDVIESTCDFSGYKLVVAPMLYMLRPGVAERIIEYVHNGGTFVATYLSGIADESDLCFLGGFPGPLRELLGIWVEEADVLYDHDLQSIRPVRSDDAAITGEYAARHFCDIVHLEGAQSLANYCQDYYAGSPALTVNEFGRGKAYYIASRNDERFTDDFLGALCGSLGLEPAADIKLPDGVTMHKRTHADQEFLFVLNFGRNAASVETPVGWQPLVAASGMVGALELPAYGAAVLHRRTSL